jgi:prepilin peptidase CpaA
MQLGYWQATWAILIPGILYASWVDGKERRVPNWLNALLLFAGCAMQGLHHEGRGVSVALVGAAVGFGVLIVPWMMHGMGAGDVKLMAAIGAWFGPWMTLWAFTAGSVIGGIMAVVMILGGGKFRHAVTNMNTIMVKLATPGAWFTEFGGARTFGETSQLLPYGIPLTIGSILILFGQTSGWWSL